MHFPATCSRRTLSLLRGKLTVAPMSLSVTSLPVGRGRLTVSANPADTAKTIKRSPQREPLLSAAARASRVLLEASEVMSAMPAVLRELGEAAGVDRTVLAIVETDTAGVRWLVVKSEWIAPSAAGERSQVERMAWDEGHAGCPCERLRIGQTVHLRPGDSNQQRLGSIASCSARSSVIVPFLVDGEYAGAIGFDDCRGARKFEPDVVSALEIAASVIGAALHRDRLAAAVRAERDRAAEQRVAELAKANAALRSNVEWLAGATDPHGFYGHMLLETVRQFNAATGTLLMLSVSDEEWRVSAHVRGGVIEEAPFAAAIPHTAEVFAGLGPPSRQPLHGAIERLAALSWPGMLEHHQRQGQQGAYVLPLLFGERTVGLLVLAFAHRELLSRQQEQLLVALGQQMTLAIVFKRLAMAARNTAVLAERNRISQEIHDGLAQAFVGILMQLAAAEGHLDAAPLASVLTRIRDLARDGLSEARRSVLALRPAESRAGGLEFALRQLAERSTVTGRLSCVFEGGGLATRLAPEHEHELLRIAQEAVSNAVRHAQPRNVQIALGAQQEFLQLSVTDDGCGMQELPELHAQQGFGLTNMRERAHAIGGEWQISSRHGAGTRIDVRVPIAVRV
jgi:signal transduction histidine kinase